MANQRWMKNLQTDVLFPYDEGQVKNNREMVECDIDGKIIVDRNSTVDNLEAQQAAKIETMEKVISTLSDKAAKLEVENETLRQKIAGGVGDDELVAVLQKENGELKSVIVEVGELALVLTDTGKEDVERIGATINRLLEVVDISPVAVGDIPLCQVIAGAEAAPVPDTHEKDNEPKTFSKDQVDAMHEEARELNIRGFTKMPPEELEAAIARKKGSE